MTLTLNEIHHIVFNRGGTYEASTGIRVCSRTASHVWHAYRSVPCNGTMSSSFIAMRCVARNINFIRKLNCACMDAAFSRIFVNAIWYFS